ncbi:MAG: COX15/CtaA family protein [Anaerolineales bacterium]|nr:COX15/CtaA family protein [Anaerolineales bacterium]MCB8961758.1 COX15/CtaA family protein [Ardenticatenales bacterium]MCB0005400.1 COX15/CtaA family protein [Anaerolineales bacterium]MCB0011482.1 COX15/CtaA family protein [Anaerolineales bacterium]MCB0016984.1 COX15/CtaA family protein [Anaerolineales bacterium]
MANVRMIRRWLLIVCGLVVFMVLFGGYVRLTRSGLSIVEWNVITGIVPPTSEADWQAEFAKYQESPEFEHVNADMTLSEYKFIFYNEYIHRLVARFAGLIVVLPFFWFLAKGIIPWRKSAIYWVVVILFGLQGAMGWYMVSSGLVDRPAVSHYRLTAHLLLALLLLSIAFLQWLHLDNRRAWHASGLLWVAGLVVGLIIIQISYGGLVAGLKAGYVSDTWPLMYGAWLPAGIFSALDPWWRNLVEALPAVHYIHRWFAFVVLLAAIGLYLTARRRGDAPALQRGLVWLLVLVTIQITLGVTVIWYHVPLVLALTHQGTALFLFLTALYVAFEAAHLPAAAPVLVPQSRPRLS